MPDMTMTNAVVDQHTRWLAKRSTSTSGRPAHPMAGVVVDQHMPDMTMTNAVVDQHTRWLAKRSTSTSGRPAHQMAGEAVDQHKWSTSTPDGWRSGRQAQVVDQHMPDITMTNAVVDQHTRWLAKRSTSTSGRPAHLDGWHGGRPASYVCNDVFPTLYSSVCKGWLDRNERQHGIG